MKRHFDLADSGDRSFVSEYLGVPTHGFRTAVGWGDPSWPDQIDLFEHDDLMAVPRSYVRVGRWFQAL